MVISRETFVSKLDRMEKSGEGYVGYAAVLSHPVTFSSINGYIDFAWFAYCWHIHPLPESPWKNTVGGIMKLLYALRDTKFDRYSENFGEYAVRIPDLIETVYGNLSISSIEPISVIEYSDAELLKCRDYMNENLCPWCFWCGDTNPNVVRKYMDSEIMTQLSNIKMERLRSEDAREVSHYALECRGSLYHEEIVSAYNLLLQDLVWCINSASTRNKASYDFDIAEMSLRAEMVLNIIRNIKNLA